MTAMTRRTFLQSSAAALSTLGASQHGFALPLQSKPAAQKPLRFGVNYVPRKNWWYCWQDWDQQSVLEDMEAIAALGMDHIRIQCLWPLIQPGINYISDAILSHMLSLLDAAGRAGLDVEVTVLNGWMSGLAFMPAWVQPTAPNSNMFTAPQIIAAEQLLFRRIAAVIGHHPRFLGFDLGNELGVLQGRENPATSPQADAWAAAMFEVCEEAAPHKFHVNGVDHQHWFADFGFTRGNLATEGSATVVHSYAEFTGALGKFGYSGEGTAHLIEYMVEFAYAYHTDLSRRVWVEEAWQPDAYFEKYIRNGAGTGKAWGITWWCSHDLDPAIGGFDDGEHAMGLLGHDNKPKAIGRKFAALAAELRSDGASSTNRDTALVVPDRGLKPSPPDWTYGDRFMKLVSQGKRPCIVLESRDKDEDYLRARGIRKLIRYSEVAL